MALVWNCVLVWFQSNVLAMVHHECNYKYFIKFGGRHILKTPAFNQSMHYPRHKVCKWAYSSLPGTFFEVTCNAIDKPRSKYSKSQCLYDRLVVSPTGDSKFSDGRTYCAQTRQPIKLQSVSNALTIGTRTRIFAYYEILLPWVAKCVCIIIIILFTCLVPNPRWPGGRYRCIITTKAFPIARRDTNPGCDCGRIQLVN